MHRLITMHAFPKQTVLTNRETAIQGHSRCICCCANRRGIYDFLLALNSNLTPIFNRSGGITPSLRIHTPPLFWVELEKDGWELVDMLWCEGSQNIELSNRKLKSALKCTV